MLMPIKTTNNIIPIRAIIRIGRTDSEVMPLMARATIFPSVYFVSPWIRGSRSYDDGGGFEPELDSEPAQEYVRFSIKRKRTQRPIAHQSEVGMVRNDIGTEPIENAIVEIGSAPFEPAVGGASLADGEHNLGSAVEMFDHLCDDRHIVLQVGIERNHSIGFADLREQSSQ